MGAALNPSRSEVRSIPCPACHAPAGEKCERARGGARESNHQDRVSRFLLSLAG